MIEVNQIYSFVYAPSEVIRITEIKGDIVWYVYLKSSYSHQIGEIFSSPFNTSLFDETIFRRLPKLQAMLLS